MQAVALASGVQVRASRHLVDFTRHVFFRVSGSSGLRCCPAPHNALRVEHWLFLQAHASCAGTARIPAETWQAGRKEGEDSGDGTPGCRVASRPRCRCVGVPSSCRLDLSNFCRRHGGDVWQGSQVDRWTSNVEVVRLTGLDPVTRARPSSSPVK